MLDYASGLASGNAGYWMWLIGTLIVFGLIALRNGPDD